MYGGEGTKTASAAAAGTDFVERIRRTPAVLARLFETSYEGPRRELLVVCWSLCGSLGRVYRGLRIVEGK